MPLVDPLHWLRVIWSWGKSIKTVVCMKFHFQTRPRSKNDIYFKSIQDLFMYNRVAAHFGRGLGYIHMNQYMYNNYSVIVYIICSHIVKNVQYAHLQYKLGKRYSGRNRQYHTLEGWKDQVFLGSLKCIHDHKREDIIFFCHIYINTGACLVIQMLIYDASSSKLVLERARRIMVSSFLLILPSWS